MAKLKRIRSAEFHTLQETAEYQGYNLSISKTTHADGRRDVNISGTNTESGKSIFLSKTDSSDVSLSFTGGADMAMANFLIETIDQILKE